MTFALPVLHCRQRVFSAPTADAAGEEWHECEAVALVDVVSGGAPKQGTIVRAGWGSEEVRFLFECTDEHPWATFTERDAPLYQEEVVEVLIDPVGDLLSYFEFEVNPLNTVMDLVLRRNRSGYLKDFRWKCEGLRSCVRMFPGGWAVELALPFAEIAPELPQPGTQWRVNFCRIDRPEGTPRELSAWSPTGLAQFHVPQRFGVLEFC
jgi:hypothetical protein